MIEAILLRAHLITILSLTNYCSRNQFFNVHFIKTGKWVMNLVKVIYPQIHTTHYLGLGQNNSCTQTEWYLLKIYINSTIVQCQMPNAIMLYKSAIQLFKLYNSAEYTFNWTLLNLNQIFTSRQTNFSISKSNATKVGQNILSNRLSSINGLIPLTWLNSSLNTFKFHCKRLLVCG